MTDRNPIALALASILAVSSHAAAQSAEDVHGSWELQSYTVEVRDTGETFSPLGEDPSGYTVFTPEGRVWFMLTGADRGAAETDAERADLFETMLAYSGVYRIEGNIWTTDVDVAWDPSWVGTEQPREFDLVGDELTVTTPWRVMPNWAERGETRSINRFVRLN